MGKENEPRTYKKIMFNYSPDALDSLTQAARIHDTSLRQQAMDAARRNRILAELELEGVSLHIVDSEGNDRGEIVFDRAQIIHVEPEQPEELPSNVIPMRRRSQQ